MQYVCRPGIVGDAPTLAELKLQFLEAMIGRPITEKRQIMVETLIAYFRETVDSGEYLARVVEIDGRIVATGGVVCYRVTPFSMGQKSGKRGYIMSVFTQPEFRRQGFARILMQALEADARAAGVEYLHLHATEMGIALYRSLGYHESDNPELVLPLH